MGASVVAVVAWGFSAPLEAQVSASERGTTTQVIAGTELEIDYGRPSLRGRGGPFGEIVAFDDTWTAGANASTRLRTSKEIVLGGVRVPAGFYSVWLEVVDGAQWRMMLHEDTTQFHAPHVPIDEEQIVFAATRASSEEIVQTLRWSFEDLRWDGGTLTMAWGAERIRVPLEVDPGFALAVDAETAALFVGEWRIDESATRPDADRIERALSNEELDESVRRYWEALRDTPTERVVEIVWDEESGSLFRTDPVMGPIFAAFYGTEESDIRMDLLLERAEGMFMQAQAVDGQLMSFDPTYAGIFEFTFGEDGRAVAFDLRDRDDEIQMTGVRVGG